MDATYFIKGQREDVATSMSNAQNIDFAFTGQNYMLNREPDYFVYIYNLSPLPYELSRPPLMKKIFIPGCNQEGVKAEFKKDGCILAFRLPQPLIVPKGNVDTNELDIIPQDAKRWAMDIINPDNLGSTVESQDAHLDPTKVFSQGANLGARGVFWSLNGPGASEYGNKEWPTNDEITRARARMEKFFRSRLDEADAVQASRPGDLPTTLGPEHHAAAEYFGEDRSWHGKKTRTDFCPICGDRMKAGAAFHRTDAGTLCVNDWDRAVKSGAVTRALAYEATGEERFAPRVAPASAVVPSTPAQTAPQTPVIHGNGHNSASKQPVPTE